MSLLVVLILGAVQSAPAGRRSLDPIPPFDELPDDLVDDAFARLDAASAASASQACRWLDRVLQSVLFRNLVFRRPGVYDDARLPALLLMLPRERAAHPALYQNLTVADVVGLHDRVAALDARGVVTGAECE